MPKLNYVGDSPMYMSTKGRWVEHSEYIKLQQEVERLKTELTKAYMKLNGVVEDDGERYKK